MRIYSEEDIEFMKEILHGLKVAVPLGVIAMLVAIAIVVLPLMLITGAL